MSRREIEASVSEIKEALPKVAVNVFVGILVWLFSSLIFIPLANYVTLFASPFVTLISLAVFSYFWSKALVNLFKLNKAFSNVMAHRKSEKREEIEAYKTFYESIGLVLLAILTYLLLRPLLNSIHPVFNGLVLITTVVIVFYFLYISIGVFSTKILERLFGVKKG